MWVGRDARLFSSSYCNEPEEPYPTPTTNSTPTSTAFVSSQLTAEPQYVKYMDQILVGPERNIKSLREPRSPREPRADAAPRERRVREPRAPREPRPDAPPVEPYSFDTMKSSSQLFLDADVVNTLMTTNIDAVNDIAQVGTGGIYSDWVGCDPWLFDP